MNLLIDIGNTNLHWALHDTAGLGPMQGLRHGQGVPLDLLAAWEVLEPPRRVLIGNVGGAPVGDAVARVIRAYWGREPECAVPRQGFQGVRVAYPEPARLGVDRWLALLAAHARGVGATLILDVGTAATFDLLAAGGHHLGGLILPGLTMMRDSLLAGTRIPPGDPDPAVTPWATDTGAAIATGSRHALAALAERLYDRLSGLSTGANAGLTAAPALLITGGDGPCIGPLISRPVELIPDLVLQGLVCLALDEGWP
ncbi:MAG TPA: type III pantothenate kinase [Lamprocystis sp. (in: g-proteobacteria)]|nr:type III pantothenate kinase [Lamprocystis sp. (in: g-proteobacteria)]